jgi:hypothetical protein
MARYANELTNEGGESYVPVNTLQGSYIGIASQHSDWRSRKHVQEFYLGLQRVSRTFHQLRLFRVPRG